MSSTQRSQDPFSPRGEDARHVEDAPPAGWADEGTFLLRTEVAPHQFGRMTYDRATERVLVAREVSAAVGHGLTSSPPRGEGKFLAFQGVASC